MDKKEITIPKFLLKEKVPIDEQLVQYKEVNDELIVILKGFILSFNGEDYPKGFWPLMDQARDVIEKYENFKPLEKELEYYKTGGYDGSW